MKYTEMKEKLGDLKVDLKKDAQIAECIENRKPDEMTKARILLIKAEGYLNIYKYQEAVELYEEFLKSYSEVEDMQSLKTEAY